MRKEEKGITLIALVITIIVLLILAGISIAMLTGEKGILKKATEAGSTTQIAEDKEAALLDLNSAYTDYMNEKYVKNNTTVATQNFDDYVKAHKITDDTHYTFEETSGKITTKHTNANGKTEEATVDTNGGITSTGWTETQ